MSFGKTKTVSKEMFRLALQQLSNFREGQIAELWSIVSENDQLDIYKFRLLFELDYQ